MYIIVMDLPNYIDHVQMLIFYCLNALVLTSVTLKYLAATNT